MSRSWHLETAIKSSLLSYHLGIWNMKRYLRRMYLVSQCFLCLLSLSEKTIPVERMIPFILLAVEIYPFGRGDYGLCPNLTKFWIYQCFSCQRTNWSLISVLSGTTQSSYLNKWSCDRFHRLKKEVAMCSMFCWLTQSSHWSAVPFAFCIIRLYQFWAENIHSQHPK